MTRRLRIGSKKFDLEDRALLLGILNVTPDSFSDGGKYLSADKAVAAAQQMERDGADIIDIGGESTRPGSTGVSTQEELDRVVPVIRRIRQHSDIPISIDTVKSAVFSEAVAAGADMLNDISGLRGDPEMLNLLKFNKLPVIIMHSKGTPDVMQKDPRYKDLIGEISEFFVVQAERAIKAGAGPVIIDPGIGFGKTVEHNFQLIKRLAEFTRLGYPIAVGPSRKSFIGLALKLEVTDRLEGTLATAAASVVNGADIVRLHDIKEGRRAIDIAHMIRYA